jgi:hypothetical protein
MTFTRINSSNDVSPRPFFRGLFLAARQKLARYFRAVNLGYSSQSHWWKRS